MRFFILVLYLTVVGVVLHSLIALARWANVSRRAKEAYYKNETLRKIAESQGAGSSSVIEFLREEEKKAARRRIEGQKLGGLIAIAVGIGMMVFIRAVDSRDPQPAYLVGLIPLLIGVALLGYAYVLAPKE